LETKAPRGYLEGDEAPRHLAAVPRMRAQDGYEEGGRRDSRLPLVRVRARCPVTTDIDALRALLRNASPPPWQHVDGETIVDSADGTSLVETTRPDDAALIVAAVNALPHLLDELKELRRTPGASSVTLVGAGVVAERKAGAP
jgi:hypothetical protein